MIARALERAWSGWRPERGPHGNVGRLFDLGFPVQRHWGARVAFYLYLGGTGGALVFIEVLLRWWGVLGARTAAVGMWIGLALAVLSVVAIFDHLGPVARWRFYLAFRRPRTSWISRGVIIVTTLLLLRLLVALPTLPAAGSLPWSEGSPAGDVLRALVLAFALAFMLYSGLVISSWSSIAFWNSPALPFLFTTSSLLGGLAALPVLAWAAEGPSAMDALGATAWPWVLVLLLVETAMVALYVQGMSTATRRARASVRMIVAGPLRARALIGVLVIGLAAPGLVVTLHVLGALPLAGVLLVAAAAAIEVGGYLLRDVVLRAGVYGPPV